MPVFINRLAPIERRHMGYPEGWRWSQVTATTLAELHWFAREVGLRRKWFQEDRYDVPEDFWWNAVKHGAIVVPRRVLIERRQRLLDSTRTVVFDPTIGTGSWPLRVSGRRR